MIKKLGLWMAAAATVVLQSCSVNSETTYYKDSATSMETKILMDRSMMAAMNVMKSGVAGNSIKDIADIPTEWESLYDIQKNGKFVLNSKDSKVLKKLFLKANKKDGEFLGLSLKYDKLLPEEIQQLFSETRELRRIPLQDIGRWNGNTLTIDTEKFNSAEVLGEMVKTDEEKTSKTPKSKSDSVEAYGRQMVGGMMGMLRMVNMNYSSTLKFQKPIKSIVGKHDFVKQIDDKTVQINVRTKELMDESHKFINKDKQVVITTE